MNRNVIKWLLIAAVIAGAAAYLFFDSGKKDGRTLANVSSKPVDVELAPGFRVTAPENALDKDREFTLKPVSEKEAQQMREAVAEAERKVVEAQTKAVADVLKSEVAAYGGDADYVRAKLYEKTAPRLTDVVTGDSPGEIFGLPMRERPRSAQQQENGGAK